jgi:hypothetical protein
MPKQETQISILRIEPADPEEIQAASKEVGHCTNARIANLGCAGCTMHEEHMGQHFLVPTCAGQTNPTGKTVSSCFTYQDFRNLAVLRILNGDTQTNYDSY